jgi:hypothetical protein
VALAVAAFPLVDLAATHSQVGNKRFAAYMFMTAFSNDEQDGTRGKFVRKDMTVNDKMERRRARKEAGECDGWEH